MNHVINDNKILLTTTQNVDSKEPERVDQSTKSVKAFSSCIVLMLKFLFGKTVCLIAGRVYQDKDTYFPLTYLVILMLIKLKGR